MSKRLLVIASVASLSVVLVSGQSAATAPAQKPAVSAVVKAQTPDAATQRALVNQYCVGLPQHQGRDGQPAPGPTGPVASRATMRKSAKKWSANFAPG